MIRTRNNLKKDCEDWVEGLLVNERVFFCKTKYQLPPFKLFQLKWVALYLIPARRR